MVYEFEGLGSVLKMASGAVPSSFTGLKNRDHHGLRFAKSPEFVKVSHLQRVKFCRTKVNMIRNSQNPGSETAELEPASEGSPLLGILGDVKYSVLLMLGIFIDVYKHIFGELKSRGPEFYHVAEINRQDKRKLERTAYMVFPHLP